jgi:hypothetical protein
MGNQRRYRMVPRKPFPSTPHVSLFSHAHYQTAEVARRRINSKSRATAHVSSA